ncbi:MAG: hypothetical protein HOD60_06860 [Candidatus Nitrosopelagicus sp.]|jgi:predicted transcriptional regulator|nr:hypothetical protein [Candidatus Nitrosopelagicus sp.]
MVNETTRDRVIFALFRKNGQLNKELIKEAKTNHNSLSLTLKQLQKEKIIVKEDDRYYFSTEIEHPSLKALGSAFSILKDLDIFIELLDTATDPFKEGAKKISEIIRLQIVLRVERFAVEKLTKRDKLEFDIYFDMLDASLELIFKILRDNNETKTNSLRYHLISSMRTPKK